MKEETKGLYLAILLSAIAIIAFNWIWPAPQPETPTEISDKPAIEEKIAGAPIDNEDSLYSPTGRDIMDIADALAKDRRLVINNDKIQGSLRLKGARFDDINLSKYKLNLEENSPNITLLQPSNTIAPYYAEFGWLSGENIKLPDNNTIWQAFGDKLTPQTPILLEWNNGQGLKFSRKISVDENYMFTIEQTIENKSGKSITVYPYGLINKVYKPDDTGSILVH